MKQTMLLEMNCLECKHQLNKLKEIIELIKVAVSLLSCGLNVSDAKLCTCVVRLSHLCYILARVYYWLVVLSTVGSHRDYIVYGQECHICWKMLHPQNF